MAWSHPDISLDDLMNVIKGFVDILILASGYQSTGLPANWDADNIKKAIQWGLFFEDIWVTGVVVEGVHRTSVVQRTRAVLSCGRICRPKARYVGQYSFRGSFFVFIYVDCCSCHMKVFKRLHGTEIFDDSIKELDAALLNLTSNPLFPQGLTHITSATLSNARYLVLEHLLATHPLTDEYILTLLTAIIEMDVNDITKTFDDGPKIYMDMLQKKIESLNLVSANDFIKGSTAAPSTIASSSTTSAGSRVCDPQMPTESYAESNGYVFVNHSYFVIRELLKRRASELCSSSAEKGLDNLLKTVTGSNKVKSVNYPSEGLPYHAISSVKEEILSEIRSWNHWRSRCLSYLLDKRTIRLLSGANLIFSAPMLQWIRVFEPLMFSSDASNDNLLEIMEILLLGFISRRWNSLIEHFNSLSCNFLPISKQYLDLHHLLQGNTQLHSYREVLNSKEKDIIEYLMQLLKSQPHKLWQVSPVLVAAAIPPGSILFRMYFNDVEKQFNEASLSTRCCGCVGDDKEHRDCKLADRIRCLHAFHIQGSDLMVYDSTV